MLRVDLRRRAEGRLLITSKQKINCSLQPDAHEAEHYHGTIRQYGLDIGATAESVIIWAVIAQQSDYVPGSVVPSRSWLELRVA